MWEDEVRQGIMDDYDRQELDEQVEQVSKLDRAQQEYFRRKAEAENQAWLQKTFKEAVKEAGLTEEAWNQLGMEAPQVVREVLAGHIKSYVKTAATKARDTKGRFVKQSKGQPAPGNQSSKSEGSLSAKSYSDSDKFLSDVVNSVLPDDDPIWRI